MVQQYFLKGDISGIQEFIFNVKSEGAAKSLKGRSFFIQVLSLIGQKLIEQKVGLENVKTFYNGGGNFYLKVEKISEKILTDLQRDIDKFCHNQNFHLTLSIIPYEKEEMKNDFGGLWEKLNIQSNKDKLSRFSDYPIGFETYPYTPVEGWKGFTKALDESEKYKIVEVSGSKFEISDRGIEVLNQFFSLKNGDKEYLNLVKRLPVWTEELRRQLKDFLDSEYQKRKSYPNYHYPNAGDIMEFSHLSGFAELRTGTNKLGILKMDIDNLGNVFNTIPSEMMAQELSQKLITPFFGETMKKLLEEKIGIPNLANTPKTFGDNIYTVFAGGDDCFFVGGWDVVLEWAAKIQQRFAKEVTAFFKSDIFQASLKDLNSLTRKKLEKLDLTLSAGYLMLESSYPVVRFADLAEKAIDQAKFYTYFNKEKNTKNKISVLGEVLTWQEFEEVLELSNILKDLVNNQNEPRATIEKLRATFSEFDSIRDEVKASNRTSQGFSVSKLFYHIRKSGKGNEAIISEKFIKPYSMALIGNFIQKSQVNPMRYPLAARLTEFHTRKKITQNAFAENA